MECPYCGAELIYDDYYGVCNISAQEKYGYGFKKLGDIYYCPNREGFEDMDSAEQYKNSPEGIDQQELRNEDVICDSSTFNGFFYTDENDNLKEGYPC